jgi:transcriptional regulator
MYTPPAFREDDPNELRRIMRECRLATLVTMTADGLLATPLPLLIDEQAGSHGTLLGHIARANPQHMLEPLAEALVIFSGPDAYITPSWYAAKRERGKVVPTWNYAAVHAYGTLEFFDDKARLHEAVTRLTDFHEATRNGPWAVADAPAPFVQSQLKGIVGVEMRITRLEGKRKMSQNRPEADRIGVVEGLGESPHETDRRVAAMIPVPPREA